MVVAASFYRAASLQLGLGHYTVERILNSSKYQSHLARLSSELCKAAKDVIIFPPSTTLTQSTTPVQ